MCMSVSREDFEVKINEVGENLYLSHFHLKIHEKMTEELNAPLKEYPSFFGWSRMAHYEAGILRLTRTYDKNSLGLLKIINILDSNYKSWGFSYKLNDEQLEQDRDYVTSEKNKLVDSLMQVRDKVISHTDNRLHPRKLSFDIQTVYGGELICREKTITTEEIENLPREERQKRLTQVAFVLHQTIEKNNAKILDKPTFEQLYELTSNGVKICNRYMQMIEILPIELKLDGID
jgi:AbiU2